MNFRRINCTEARELVALHKDQGLQIVDIRDDESFERGHIESALHLHGSNLQDFITGADLAAPVLVYCYHGHMSQSAAAHLAEQGFELVFSMDGGFEAWES